MEPGNLTERAPARVEHAITQTDRFPGRIEDVSHSVARLADNIEPLLEQTQRMAEHLQTALSVLATIDEAVGILISRGGGNAEEAVAALREVSRSHHTDLGTVARRIVEGVSRGSQLGHIRD